MERPDLQITQILVTTEVPVRGWTAFPEDIVHKKASFYVNTDTWECEGHVAGHPVLADEEWWKEQCQKVSDRVRAGITSLTV